jgi:hypothetical protein
MEGLLLWVRTQFDHPIWCWLRIQSRRRKAVRCTRCCIPWVRVQCRRRRTDERKIRQSGSRASHLEGQLYKLYHAMSCFDAQSLSPRGLCKVGVGVGSLAAASPKYPCATCTLTTFSAGFPEAVTASCPSTLLKPSNAQVFKSALPVSMNWTYSLDRLGVA